MTLRKFVKAYRQELEEYVKRKIDQPAAVTLVELEDWVRNDEGLYNWARSEGWPG